MARFDTHISGNTANGNGNGNANGNDNTTIKWIVVDRPSTNLPSNPTFVGSCPADSLGKYVVAVEVDSTGNIISEIGRIQLPAQPGVAAALVAGGQDRNVRELTNFAVDDIKFVARCGDREATIPLRMVMDNIVVPAPAPAPAPAPVPTPAAPTPTPAPTPDVGNDDYRLFFKPGTADEELCNEGNFSFWRENLERGYVSEGDFEFRIPRTVLGIVVASETKSDVKFRKEYLEQVLA